MLSSLSKVKQPYNNVSNIIIHITRKYILIHIQYMQTFRACIRTALLSRKPYQSKK